MYQFLKCNVCNIETDTQFLILFKNVTYIEENSTTLTDYIRVCEDCYNELEVDEDINKKYLYHNNKKYIEV